MADEKKTNALVHTKKVMDAAGALPLDYATLDFQTTAVRANTLADGEDGQRMTLLMTVDGGTATITPANLVGSTSIALGDVGDAVILEFSTGNGWVIVSNNGAVLA